MTILSQRDPRWAGILLGTSTIDTIGRYGCLITCFSMYIGKNPDEVNTILKNNSGFTSGDLFIWAKSTALGLNQTYLSPRFADIPVTLQTIQKAKDYLDQGYPLVCEIDFNPNTNGEEMHFVLLVRHDGDVIYAYDPWTGTEINLDVYGGAARCIIQFRAYDKKIVPEPVVVVDPDKIKVDLGSELGVMEVQAIRSLISDLNRDLKSANDKYNGFVAKWIEEWNLPTTSTMVDVEAEMAKLMMLEETVSTYRTSIETCVGEFPSDTSLLEAHKAVRGQIKTLMDENAVLVQKLADAKVPAGYLFLKSWTLYSLLFKLYKKKVG